ncbi:hypothetical protein CC117_29495 [Parafrankia colletiae]|uniref:DUF3618 domain-containing protein n=1 Tax=Parafrankia colletiae TaxID=573497 RepID=A0A1S1Q4Y6_9ACTN|nr:DUF3618 domain-containing protein [Parafrankia colletiae]MCK9903036.1 DUF3618 domain-containing protein [Frankia sp. Cpl3]OHV29000.1 hypothetical protein CC117_29495 [Parafrankia colletiae]
MTSPKSDEIRSEIEATRAQLGHDLDELSDRISPQKVAGRTAQGVKTKVTTASSAGRDKARENPRAAGTAAGGLAAVGLLTSMIARRRRRRHRAG